MRIGVAIPVYNEIKYIDCCLESLRKQTHPVDVYLVSDASSDGTYEFLQSRPSLYKRLARMPVRSGWPVALNTAMQMAIDDGCDAVMPFNGDDFMRLDAIQKLADALPGHDWACGYGQQIGEENVVQTPLKPFPLQLKDFSGPHCPIGHCCLYRPEVWASQNGFDTTISLPDSFGYNEEWDFWIRAFKAGYGNGILVKEPICYYVMRGKQLHREGTSRHAEARKLVMDRHPDVFAGVKWSHCACGCM